MIALFRRSALGVVTSALLAMGASFFLGGCAGAGEATDASEDEIRGDRQRNCTAICGAGTVCDEATRVCVADLVPPRVTFPLSGDRVTGKPAVRWKAQSGGASDAVLEICADVACTSVVTTLTGSATASPASVLPRGAYFVRAFGRRKRANGTYLEGATPSATSVFFSSGRSAKSRGPLGIVPDVDRDGIADIGISGSSGNQSVISVSASATKKTLRVSGTPEQPRGNVFGGFAKSMVSASDVDGDGYPEIAAIDPEGPSNATSVVRFGYDPVQKKLVERQRFDVALPAGERFLSLAPMGDIDGDGFADIAIVRALPSVAASGPSGGTMWYQTGLEIETLYGSATGWSRSTKTQIPFSASERTFENTPVRVRGVGDVDGDGVPDIAISLQTSNPDSCLPMRRGRVEIRRGSADGKFSNLLGKIEDAFDVAPLGDVNGDGYADIGVTREPHETRAPIGSATTCNGSYTRTGFVPGEAKVIFGGASATLKQVALAMPVETLPNCRGGIVQGADYPVNGTLIGGGDLDGDGLDDFALVSKSSRPGGAQLCDDGGSLVYVLPGTTSATLRVSQVLPTSDAGYGDFSGRLRIVGDVDTSRRSALTVVGTLKTVAFSGNGSPGTLALTRTLSSPTYGELPLGGL